MAGLAWNRSASPLDTFRESPVNGMVMASNGSAVGSGLAVSQRGAGANMSVDVAVGAWSASGVLSAKTSVTNIVISAADVTNPRYDLITADNAGALAVVTGTAAAAANTQIPALPANKIPLAVVAVAANAASIVTANITDVRIIKQTPSCAFLIADATTATLASSNATWTALKTWSITAAQAYSANIVVTVQGQVQSINSGGNSTTGHIRLTTGATPGTLLGSDLIGGIISSATTVDSCCLHFVLVAGTNYTLGTAFTLNVEAECVNGGGANSVTQTYMSSSVVGYY